MAANLRRSAFLPLAVSAGRAQPFPMVLLLFLVLTLLVAGIGGWAADTRDVSYGLWPMRRGKPSATTARRIFRR